MTSDKPNDIDLALIRAASDSIDAVPHTERPLVNMVTSGVGEDTSLFIITFVVPKVDTETVIGLIEHAMRRLKPFLDAVYKITTKH